MVTDDGNKVRNKRKEIGQIKNENKPHRDTKFFHASTNPTHSPLVRVAGMGLRSRSLGLGDNYPLLVKSLEEMLDNGAMSDFSTLRQMNQSSC